MSRFHDEFFRQGSPVHDTLMIKCLSAAGVEKIISSVDFGDIFKELLNHIHEGVICTFDDNGRCWNPGTIEGFMSKTHDGFETCAKPCGNRAKCEHAINISEKIFGTRSVHVPASIAKKILYPSISVVQSIKKETEVIMRNGTFIIGYADAIISINYKGRVEYKVDAEWTIQGSAIDKTTKIVVEAKPEISSIGEVIRQLKTYRESLIGSLHPIYQGRQALIADGNYVKMVIVTYTKLSQDAIEYLLNENIVVVRFEHGESG